MPIPTLAIDALLEAIRELRTTIAAQPATTADVLLEKLAQVGVAQAPAAAAIAGTTPLSGALEVHASPESTHTSRHGRSRRRVHEHDESSPGESFSSDDTLSERTPSKRRATRKQVPSAIANPPLPPITLPSQAAPAHFELAYAPAGLADLPTCTYAPSTSSTRRAECSPQRPKRDEAQLFDELGWTDADREVLLKSSSRPRFTEASGIKICSFLADVGLYLSLCR